MINEDLFPAKEDPPCSDCAGVGVFVTKGGVKPCEVCEGSGLGAKHKLTLVERIDRIEEYLREYG
tara:strand:+ start:852 stop:1046 length:195 start_codon:yes stop_codon:yes gene_type:complete